MLNPGFVVARLPRRRHSHLFTPEILFQNRNRSFSNEKSKDFLKGLSSSSGNHERQSKPKPLVGGQITERRKKTTLDDFFASLASNNNKHNKPAQRKFAQKKKDDEQRQVIENDNKFPFKYRRDSVNESSPQRVDRMTLFDDINKMVATKKAEQEKTDRSHDVIISELHQTSSPSILDLLPPARARSPHTYDDDAFDQYMDILDTILEDQVFMHKHGAVLRLAEQDVEAVTAWLSADEPVVKYSLPTLENLEHLSEAELNNNTELRNQLRGDFSDQRHTFVEYHGWDTAQYNFAMRSLRRLGNLCAKKASGPAAEIAWAKLKEAGFNMDQDTVQNYLYVISTFSPRLQPNSSSQSTSVLDLLDNCTSPETTGERRTPETTAGSVDVATEVALCHDALFGPSEQSTSIRVRRLVSQGKAAEAEQLLERNASDELRLRTYEPVFQCYLEQNDVSCAFNLYVKMKGDATVHLRPETYIQLMSAMAENGCFRPGAPAIDIAKKLGYEQASGPELFDQLAKELADDVVEISAAAAKSLHNALSKGFKGHALKPLHLLQSMEINNVKADYSELVASRVSLNTNTGECPRTGVRLRLISLDDDQTQKLKEGLHYLASAAYEERRGENGTKATENLRSFGDWLANRPGHPFTAIVDGPNVGYYFQNFDEGRFNFHQIQFVVDALENMGENVLVILPKKYTQKSFTLTNATGRRRQTLSLKEKKICDQLIASGKAFIVPPSFLDDYYWMYASVAGQGEKWTSDLQYVLPDNEEGRWPGIRPMLVSNDQMRDHKLSLLEPRLFRRWHSTFIVNFTFSAFIGDECADKEIGFRPADFYSREIQGNPVLDDDGKKHGTVWHFPVSDWEENESFCIRIPPK